jgi:hypothetical protein
MTFPESVMPAGCGGSVHEPQAGVSAREPAPHEDAAPVSRQRKLQMQYAAEGRCRYCGAPRGDYADRCDPCGLKQRLRMRERQGCKAWRPGGRGRPPKNWVAASVAPGGAGGRQ